MNWLVLLSAAAAIAGAHRIEGKVEGLTTQDFATTSIVAASSKDKFVTYPSPEGNFSFESLSDELYYVQLQSTSLRSPRIFALDLSQEEFKTYTIYPGTLQPDGQEPTKLPLIIPTIRTMTAMNRPRFSLIQQVKSPTVYLSLLMLLAVWYLPKLVESIKQDLSEQALADAEAEAVNGADAAKEITREKPQRTRAERRRVAQRQSKKS